jgi:hypothetical protein
VPGTMLNTYKIRIFCIYPEVCMISTYLVDMNWIFIPRYRVFFDIYTLGM